MRQSEREKQQRYICQNRRARRDYFIEETIEAGMVLLGSEVKSLRAGKAQLNDAYAAMDNGELWLRNAHIAEYPNSREDHDPLRPRKLLVRERELRKLASKIEERGFTLIPLALYFSERGFAKVELGLGRGKRQYDKRHAVAERDAAREMEREVKERR